MPSRPQNGRKDERILVSRSARNESYAKAWKIEVANVAADRCERTLARRTGRAPLRRTRGQTSHYCKRGRATSRSERAVTDPSSKKNPSDSRRRQQPISPKGRPAPVRFTPRAYGPLAPTRQSERRAPHPKARAQDPDTRGRQSHKLAHGGSRFAAPKSSAPKASPNRRAKGLRTTLDACQTENARGTRSMREPKLPPAPEEARDNPNGPGRPIPDEGNRPIPHTQWKKRPKAGETKFQPENVQRTLALPPLLLAPNATESQDTGAHRDAACQRFGV